jgi:hypothetical protein
VDVLPGASYEYEEFYHTDQMMELARPAAGLLKGLEKGEKDALQALVKSYAEKDGLEADTLFLAARLAWLVGDMDLTRTFVKRAENEHGEMVYGLLEIPVDAICRFWLVSLAYQEEGQAAVKDAAATLRARLDASPDAAWTYASCVALSAYLPDASYKACSVADLCLEEGDPHMICVYAQTSAAALAYEAGEGPAWCQDLPFMQAGKDQDFAVATSGMSMMASTDLVLAGVGGSVMPYDGNERVRVLHPILSACYKKALAVRLPNTTQDAAKLSLGSTRVDPKEVDAVRAQLHELAASDSYYAPFAAYRLVGRGKMAHDDTGWNYDRLGEAYPWLRKYVPEHSAPFMGW